MTPSRDATRTLGAIALTALTRPEGLQPEDVALVEARLAAEAGGADGREMALGALAATLYARPALVSDGALTRCLDHLARELTGSPVAVAGLIEAVVAGAAAPAAARQITTALAAGIAHEGSRQAWLTGLSHLAQWRPDLLPLDEFLVLAASPALAAHRQRILGPVLEPLLARAPEAVDLQTLDRIERLFGACPRLAATRHALAGRPATRPEVRARIAGRSADAFPHRARAAAVLERRPFRLLVVHNVRVGQGDDLIRHAPLLQAFLDASPDLTVTMITRRTYLWDHSRVTTIRIGDTAAVEGALAGPFDGLVEISEPKVREANERPALRSRLAGAPRQQEPALVIAGDVGHGRAEFQRIMVAGHDVAAALRLDREDLDNVYDAGTRLLAELGLWPRLGEDPPRGESVLTGTVSADAEVAWRRLCAPGDGRRPIALVNPFGGASPVKGYLWSRAATLARDLGGLVAEGYDAVLLPNGTAWGTMAAVARVLDHLPPTVRRHIAVAPDPVAPQGERLSLVERPELPYADRVMRLFKYFAARADFVVTVEGWLAHLAWNLGRPFRLVLAAQSHSHDWYPKARGPDQRLATALSPPPPSAAATELLRPGDPAPVPFRPRKALLLLALRALGLDSSDAVVEVLARAQSSEDLDVRAAAAAGLGRVRPIDRVKGWLIESLGDGEPAVRAEAAVALRASGADCREALGPQFHAHLLAHLAIARQQWATVARLGAAAIPALEAAVAGENNVTRREATQMLRALVAAGVTRQPDPPPGGAPALLIRGSFRGTTGHDHHVREFVRGLARLGVRQQLVDFPAWSPAKLPADKREPWFDTLAAPVGASAALHFCMPHQVQLAPGLLNVNYTMFEAVPIPPAWARLAERHDLVVVPTESSREAWRAAGAPDGRLRVGPLGVDTARFRPGHPPLSITTREGRPVTDYRTRVLNVSDPSPRKNLLALLRVWIRVTRADDDAVLIVKLGMAGGAATLALLHGLEGCERQLGRRRREAAPIVLFQSVLADDEMPSLYAVATHYWSMSHGEGWDQPMMEAGASGLGLIAPRHSAYTAYLDETVARLIPARLVPAAVEDDPGLARLFAGASWWEPDEDTAGAEIRRAIDGPGEPARARDRLVREFTWDHAARRLLAIVDELHREHGRRLAS